MKKEAYICTINACGGNDGMVAFSATDQGQKWTGRDNEVLPRQVLTNCILQMPCPFWLPKIRQGMQVMRAFSEVAPVATLEHPRKIHLSEHTDDYMSCPEWTLGGK